MAEAPDRKELKAQWKTEVEVPHMKLEDVAKHSTKTDLWIVIHGKVYDVTKYARDHPGGAESLIEVAGQDATSAYEDVGHSEDAREIMHPFLVGILEGAVDSGAQKKPKVQVVRRGPSKQESKSNLLPQIELAVFAVGTIAAVWWIVRAAAHSPTISKSLHGGFTSGFLWATAACGGAAIMGYRRLTQAMSFGGTPHPAHFHAAHAVSSTNHPAGVLKPQEYQRFPLIRKDVLSKDSFRLVFKLPASYSVLGLPIGQHVAIRGYFDDESGHHTVTRSYTPVSNNKDLGRLELVIKMYPDGQLTGKYLSKLEIGDQVEFRGPKGAMKYRKGTAKSIGMIAGGTGITPMYQLIRSICEDKTDDTQVTLLYANRSPPEILLKTQLDRFQKMAPNKFHIHYIVDKPTEGWTGDTGYITKKMIEERLPKPSKDSKILLCGPPGMINASKKNLVELGFEAPGAVTKMGDQVFLF